MTVAFTYQNTRDLYDDVHNGADAFIAGKDLGERIAWLRSIRIPEQAILAALGNPADPDLDEFARDAAHEIAAEILDNGGAEFAA